MSEVPSRCELILYRTEDGRDTIRLRVVVGTVLLTEAERPIHQEPVVKESLTTDFVQHDRTTTCKDFLQVRSKEPAVPRAPP